jgi:hypothetical protein
MAEESEINIDTRIGWVQVIHRDGRIAIVGPYCKSLKRQTLWYTALLRQTPNTDVVSTIIKLFDTRERVPKPIYSDGLPCEILTRIELNNPSVTMKLQDERPNSTMLYVLRIPQVSDQTGDDKDPLRELGKFLESGESISEADFRLETFLDQDQALYQAQTFVAQFAARNVFRNFDLNPRLTQQQADPAICFELLHEITTFKVGIRAGLDVDLIKVFGVYV